MNVDKLSLARDAGHLDEVNLSGAVVMVYVLAPRIANHDSIGFRQQFFATSALCLARPSLQFFHDEGEVVAWGIAIGRTLGTVLTRTREDSLEALYGLQ